ncbi:O-succinylbenzoic acid--CoA ligase [Prauserella sediminis]|uniref:O-succinylbenzoic acid--CoA ligase n=1 Tax=Prauserella sediminis TaxID=577680 RepID=A0A839XKC5_9PSEU|nr:AMP-binding protein [Prauserella sediminis]MBB3662269.1 O-succinylbenzoic acid--CoA ligase [Prauserella sediminis]
MQVVFTDGSPASVAALDEALCSALDGGETLLPLDPRSPRAESLREAMAPGEPVEPDTAVIIPTSGSTGEAKGVLLSASALLASARATHARLGGPGRWLLATPANYVGGLQVLTRAQLAGCPPTTLDIAGGFRPDAFVAATDELLGAPGPHSEGPYYTALVPTQLARLLAAGPDAVHAAAAYDAIVLGGARLDDELARRAADAGVRAVSSYGMSETASGCVYDGFPLEGVSVRLGDGDRIELSGATLSHGYRMRPDLTAHAFTADGWLRTSDVGSFHDDGALVVLGRVDDMLNTGGVKVPAAGVEAALTAHPEVRAACVVALPDPEWGQRIAAVIVPEPREPGPAQPAAGDEAPGDRTGRAQPRDDLDEQLRALVRERLGRAAVPKLLRQLPELPLIGPGKVDRAAVRAVFDD